jgi:hypothetical protein
VKEKRRTRGILVDPENSAKEKVFSGSTQIHVVALREAKTSAVLIWIHYHKMSLRKKFNGF